MNGKVWQRIRASGVNSTTQGAQGDHQFGMSALSALVTNQAWTKVHGYIGMQVANVAVDFSPRFRLGHQVNLVTENIPLETLRVRPSLRPLGQTLKGRARSIVGLAGPQ
jgi:hypothetical protein